MGKRKAEPDISKPAYVWNARLGSSVSMFACGFCPQIVDRNNTVYSWLKSRKQLECHPMKKYVDEAAAEWNEYGRKWKEQDNDLKDPPPYPYTHENVQEPLDEMAEFEKRQWEKQKARMG